MSTLKEQMTDGNVSESIGPYFRVVRPEMLEFVPPNATTILDVGCADGTFGSLLKKTAPCCSSMHRIEWGEGNHLEPDQRYGRLYLEGLREALRSVNAR